MDLQHEITSTFPKVLELAVVCWLGNGSENLHFWNSVGCNVTVSQLNKPVADTPPVETESSVFLLFYKIILKENPEWFGET